MVLFFLFFFRSPGVGRVQVVKQAKKPPDFIEFNKKKGQSYALWRKKITEISTNEVRFSIAVPRLVLQHRLGNIVKQSFVQTG